MWNTKKIVLLVCTGFLLAGCANQNMQMQREDVLERNKTFHTDKVSFVDDMDVLISDIREFRENDFLKVMIEFMNADDAVKRDFVYQIEWYDKYGMLKETTSWRPKSVVGNQKVKILEMATMPSIVDYKIIISTKK